MRTAAAFAAGFLAAVVIARRLTRHESDTARAIRRDFTQVPRSWPFEEIAPC